MAIDVGHPSPLFFSTPLAGAADTDSFFDHIILSYVHWTDAGYGEALNFEAGLVGAADGDTYRQHIAIFYIKHVPPAVYFDCPW